MTLYKPFPFYWPLLNTWRGFSPKWKYQKHLKLWPLYVSFVASKWQRMRSLDSANYFFRALSRSFLSTSFHKFGRITFCFLLEILKQRKWSNLSLYGLSSLTRWYLVDHSSKRRRVCILSVFQLYLSTSLFCICALPLITVSFALLNKETMIRLRITMVSSPRRSVFADD